MNKDYNEKEKPLRGFCDYIKEKLDPIPMNMRYPQ